MTSGLPNNIGDFSGPVQVMEMVVPAHSTQTSISSEGGLHGLQGFGAGSGVSPWTDPSFLLQRSSTSGTQNMIGAAINLPPANYVWFGVVNGTSSDVVHGDHANVGKGLDEDGGSPSATLTQQNIDSTMGILRPPTSPTATDRSSKPLAFQDVGEGVQLVPRLDPDLTSTKKSVRDGHYPIWGPSHFLAYVDSNGNPVNATVKSWLIPTR